MWKLNATTNYPDTNRSGTEIYFKNWSLKFNYVETLEYVFGFDERFAYFLTQANEIARLIRQYITIDQRMKGTEDNEKEMQDRDSAAKEINADHNGDEKVGSE